MKKTLIIAAVCGITAVVGIVLYISNKKENDENIKDQEPIRNKSEENIPTVSYSDLHEHKVDVASTISKRHSVAAQIISETINGGNNDVSESKHKVDFDEIDNNLDILLEEE